MISENNSTSINLALQGIIESVQQGKEEIFAISETKIPSVSAAIAIG